jgi:hypothetical protein
MDLQPDVLIQVLGDPGGGVAELRLQQDQAEES